MNSTGISFETWVFMFANVVSDLSFYLTDIRAKLSQIKVLYMSAIAMSRWPEKSNQQALILFQSLIFLNPEPNVSLQIQ